VPLRLALTHADEQLREPQILVEGDGGRLEWNFAGAVTANGTVLVTSDSDLGRQRMFASAAGLAGGSWDGLGCTAEQALPHVAVVELLTALPVTTVSGGEVHRDGEDRQRVIPGVAARAAAWAAWS